MEQKTEASQAVKFRKKPVEIEAIQWNGTKFDTTPPQWFCDAMYAFGKPGFIMRFDNNIIIETLEGQMTAAPGDWVIRGVKGEIYPCKPDVFEMTYERAALKAQPAPTEAAQGEPAAHVTIADAKFAIKQMQSFVNTDNFICLMLDDNIDTLRKFVHCRAEAAIAERAAQGEDSARLDWLLPNLHPADFGFDFDGGYEWKSMEEFLRKFRTAIDRARPSAETGEVKP